MAKRPPPSRPPAPGLEVKSDDLTRRLEAEPLYELPDGLEARILAGLPERRPLERPTLRLRLRPVLRAAAAVLVAFVAWFAATGALPRAAVAAPAIRDALRPAEDLLPPLPAVDPAAWLALPPLLTLGLGVGLLGFGLVLARRLLAPDRRSA